MTLHLTRRKFSLSGAAAAMMLPAVAKAQQPLIVGWLTNDATLITPSSRNAIRLGLSEFGYIEGQNLAFITRSAEQYDQLAERAAELVDKRVALILATGTANAALAAISNRAFTEVPSVLGITFANVNPLHVVDKVAP